MAEGSNPFQKGRSIEADHIDPRAPAHAVRQLVQQEGRDVPRALYEAFDANNAEHFGGLLKQSLILLTAPASPRAEGDYVAQDVHGIPSRIRIAPRCERRGILYLSDILLHEMIHAWQAEQIGDLENGYRGHGPKFCQKANEIGARVRELRHARGMSLGELERVSGVWKGSLSLIERGRVNLTVRTCVRIARGLGVEVVDLFSEPGG